MALEHRLDLRLSQKLVLTPQLQLAIKLLQHTQLELTQAINQELMENPFLEEDVSDEADQTVLEETGDVRIEDVSYEDAATDKAEEFPSDEGEGAAAEATFSEEAEIDYENLFTFSNDDYFDDRGSDGRDLGYFDAEGEEMPSYDAFYAKKPDLYEHLLWQLRLSTAEEDQKKIAEAVIANLDEDGYLRVSNEEIASLLKVEPDLVEEAIRLVQAFDPSGVCARDLKECLLLQIYSLDLSGTIAEKIVKAHIIDLQNKRYQAIAKQLAVSLDDVLNAVKVIERLEPRPGRQFSGSETNYITPDVYIEKVDGDYRIIINEEGIPRLTISSRYKQLLSNKDKLSKEDLEFLRDKLRKAVELTKSLEQRNRTIYKVSASILKFQRDFFDFGSQYIKPLNLKDVASDIGMHESTISRVTSNKYLSCSHGVLSFRYFFSSSVSGQDGDVSSTIVKDIIKQVVAAEDPNSPMSDQSIANMLKDKGINIARRTVAKYREELKIPPQNRRRKMQTP